MKFPKPVKAVRKPKPIPRRSIRMKEKMDLYHKLRKAFLIDHPWCQACAALGKRPQLSKEIHHKLGRVGPLLLDVRHWMASCLHCHNTIHLDIPRSRSLGLIGELGQWNNTKL